MKARIELGGLLSLFMAQVRYNNRVFWNTRSLVFFNILLPVLIFLGLCLSREGSAIEGAEVMTPADFYGPGIAAFGVVSATFSYLAISTAIAREQGFLKKIRGTPMPSWIHVASRIASATWMAVIAGCLILAMREFVEPSSLTLHSISLSLLVILIGAFSFAAQGLALACFCPTGAAAPAIANAVLLSMAFGSGIFFPLDQGPAWILVMAEANPLAAFANGLRASLSGTASFVTDLFAPLVVVCAWGTGALVLAHVFFRWEPNVAVASGKRGSDSPTP